MGVCFLFCVGVFFLGGGVGAFCYLVGWEGGLGLWGVGGFGFAEGGAVGWVLFGFWRWLRGGGEVVWGGGGFFFWGGVAWFGEGGGCFCLICWGGGVSVVFFGGGFLGGWLGRVLWWVFGVGGGQSKEKRMSQRGENLVKSA